MNGLLVVEATVHKTGAKESIVIQEHSGVLSSEEIRSRLQALASLKLHPREEARNAAIMARANRLFEEALGPARMTISRALAQFEAILERQEPHEVASAREQFQVWLDQFESNPLIDA